MTSKCSYQRYLTKEDIHLQSYLHQVFQKQAHLQQQQKQQQQGIWQVMLCCSSTVDLHWAWTMDCNTKLFWHELMCSFQNHYSGVEIDSTNHRNSIPLHLSLDQCVNKYLQIHGPSNDRSHSCLFCSSDLKQSLAKILPPEYMSSSLHVYCYDKYILIPLYLQCGEWIYLK